jgi:putative oxidoreductase
MNVKLNDDCEVCEPIAGVSSRIPARFHIARWAPLPLRLIVGFGFMAHGIAKLSKGPDAFAMVLQGIGVPAPHLMSWLTILVEVFGGLAIMLGAFITIASLPLAAILLVAMFTVHLPNGFSSIRLLKVTPAGAEFGPPGYECNLLYLSCLATLVIGGPGPLAIGGRSSGGHMGEKKTSAPARNESNFQPTDQ